jgi:hypothetical protein
MIQLIVPLVPFLQLVRGVGVVHLARRVSWRGGAQASLLVLTGHHPRPGQLGQAGPGHGRTGPAPLVGRRGRRGRCVYCKHIIVPATKHVLFINRIFLLDRF